MPGRMVGTLVVAVVSLDKIPDSDSPSDPVTDAVPSWSTLDSVLVGAESASLKLPVARDVDVGVVSSCRLTGTTPAAARLKTKIRHMKAPDEDLPANILYKALRLPEKLFGEREMHKGADRESRDQKKKGGSLGWGVKRKAVGNLAQGSIWGTVSPSLVMDEGSTKKTRENLVGARQGSAQIRG